MFLRILVLLLVPSLALAAVDKRVHVEWGYTPPTSPTVSGFQLYQEGIKSAPCYFPGASTTSGSCTVSLSKVTTDFTITATFVDGSESPHSAPFALTVVPTPVILSITPIY